MSIMIGRGRKVFAMSPKLSSNMEVANKMY